MPVRVASFNPHRFAGGWRQRGQESPTDQRRGDYHERTEPEPVRHENRHLVLPPVPDPPGVGVAISPDSSGSSPGVCVPRRGGETDRLPSGRAADTAPGCARSPAAVSRSPGPAGRGVLRAVFRRDVPVSAPSRPRANPGGRWFSTPGGRPNASTPATPKCWPCLGFDAFIWRI